VGVAAAAGETQSAKSTSSKTTNPLAHKKDKDNNSNNSNNDNDNNNGSKTAAWVSLTAGLLTILFVGAPPAPPLADLPDDDASAIWSSEGGELRPASRRRPLVLSFE
jgi:hypothetical protein